ncbi:MAG: E3 binding domain-containing protein, partial [Candidatus Dormibacteraeota bacterium]|nr:E3 binding domain-containing protein [Candidatus Dormibacteraeota bacterium]
MPQLGESVTEGHVCRWLKQPGERVEKYEALVEVITDKVNAEVPSPVAGVLGEIMVAEGETVEVGTLICSIIVDGGTAAAGSPDEGGGATAHAAVAAEETARVVPAAAPATAPAANGADRKDRAGRASPAVRRIAEENGIDIGVIKGSGIGGRVTKKDVEDHLASGGAR